MAHDALTATEAEHAPHSEAVAEASPEPEPARQRPLQERLLQRVATAASVEAVFGAPVSAHGRTVIPVARTHFLLGGGGVRGEGRSGARELGQGRAGGEGAGGAGWTVPQGYIELSPEGARYVAFSDRLGRLLGAGVGVMLGLALGRLLRRR